MHLEERTEVSKGKKKGQGKRKGVGVVKRSIRNLTRQDGGGKKSRGNRAERR